MTNTSTPKLQKLIHAFIGNEKSGGILLIICTAVSLFLANSAVGHSYTHFWHEPLLGKTIEFWINDGLMTIFFLLVGLEIKHEMLSGELSDVRQSMLPLLAALGGMLVPAAIHLFFNYGTATQSGVGIPMATDIAFSLGVLSLLGNRIPLSLKIFLTALAIIDDLGAIIVIAVFYSSSFSLLYFGLAIGIFAVLMLLNRFGVRNLIPYLLLGGLMWYFMSLSGIHATITGVLLAFAIPYLKGSDDSPSLKLMDWLEVPVAYIILPVFALANTGILVEKDWTDQLTSVNSLGIILALVIGKPLGILLFSGIGSLLGWCKFPTGVSLSSFIGVAMLAGIGFTMSIFIALLAFDTPELIGDSKIAVLIASGISALLGFVVLWISTRKQQASLENVDSEEKK